MSTTQSLSRAMRPCDDIVGLIGEAVVRKREEDTLEYWRDLYTRHHRQPQTWHEWRKLDLSLANLDRVFPFRHELCGEDIKNWASYFCVYQI